MPQVLLPTAYLPPVQFYSQLISNADVLIEHFEHFVKQTYRNRCYIYSPNGRQTLVVPLAGRTERTITKDIRISYNDPWQKLHWRSFEAAYRRSAFFEFYEDDIHPFYTEKKYDFLIDFNLALMELINTMLKLNVKFSTTATYEKNPTAIADFRSILSPKSKLSADSGFQLKEYAQVFDLKHGFIPNLSIVDLLFNHGPRTLEYL